MDDQNSATTSGADAMGEYRPASTGTWMKWVWISVLLVAVIAGVVGGREYSRLEPENFDDSFNGGASVVWFLLSLVISMPLVFVAGMVKKGLDAQADLAARIEELIAGEGAAGQGAAEPSAAGQVAAPEEPDSSPAERA